MTKNTVCVKECPKVNKEKVECYPNKDITKCDNFETYATTKVSERFCWPQGDLGKKLKSGLNKYASEEWFNDIFEAKWVILGCVGIALLASLVYLYVLE